MADIICYIKNKAGENEIVTSKEQINGILRERILDLTGGVENELRNLRRSLVDMWIINHPKLYSKDEVDKAYKDGEKMFELNDKMEKILKEGHDVKTLLNL